VWIHLPAGSAVYPGGFAKDLRVTLGGELQLTLGPARVGVADAILPADMVPAVDARLEAGFADAAQDSGAAAADIRAR